MKPILTKEEAADIRDAVSGILAKHPRLAQTFFQGLTRAVSAPAKAGANTDIAERVAAFLQDTTVAADPRRGGRIIASALFERFCKWCIARQCVPCSQTLFGRTLNDLGHEGVRSSGYIYRLGLRWIDDAPPGRVW
jgi:hypothetical protein